MPVPNLIILGVMSPPTPGVNTYVRIIHACSVQRTIHPGIVFVVELHSSAPQLVKGVLAGCDDGQLGVRGDLPTK